MSVKNLKWLFLICVVTLRVESLILSKQHRKLGTRLKRHLEEKEKKSIYNCSGKKGYGMAGCIQAWGITIILGLVAMVVIIFGMKWLFEKGEEKYNAYQANRNMQIGRRLQHKRPNRALISSRFHSMMRHIRGNKLLGIKRPNDLKNPAIVNKVYHTINALSQKLSRGPVSRRLFDKVYHKAMPFVYHRLSRIPSRQLGLGSLISTATAFLSKYKKFNNPGTKLMLLMNAGQIIQNLPMMLKLLNQG